jgi:hypothetical protein
MGLSDVISAVRTELFSKKEPNMFQKLHNLELSGANPTIVSYNTSVVKIYNATSSLVRFGDKKLFHLL